MGRRSRRRRCPTSCEEILGVWSYERRRRRGTLSPAPPRRNVFARYLGALRRRWIDVAGNRIGEADAVVRRRRAGRRHSGHAALAAAIGLDLIGHVGCRGPITFTDAHVQPSILEILFDLVGWGRIGAVRQAVHVLKVRSIEPIVAVREARAARIVFTGVTGRGPGFVDPFFGIVQTIVGHWFWFLRVV